MVAGPIGAFIGLGFGGLVSMLNYGPSVYTFVESRKQTLKTERLN